MLPNTKYDQSPMSAQATLFKKITSDPLQNGIVTTACLSSHGQENFFQKLKIKFIFFLSVSQLISSLKPAGEDGQKTHVNKL
jgi:hypothetical protein